MSALEILEHLVPAAVPAALAELRRVTGGVLYATIPSFGVNASGPDGHFDGKVRPERLAHYGPSEPTTAGRYPPRTWPSTPRASRSRAICTIASFTWWSDRFAEAGFERQVEIERRLYADIAPAGLGPFWNLYVLAVPEVADELLAPRFEGADPGRARPGPPLRRQAQRPPETEGDPSKGPSQDADEAPGVSSRR